ncbi:carboxymuconolactone decarboxylase family protein [Streptomyces sp. NPDC005480]|uniref:carboxymuconolactone decarboxylase family protein n=1 Tax=Streptomyces sp. NPDC005480 TaxID=3154880 RepID=UPI0033BEE4A2
MSRIRHVGDGEDPDFDELHAGMRNRPGGIPNISRILGHNVPLLRDMQEYSNALRFASGFDTRTVELVILAVAHGTGSTYTFAHHIPAARSAGISDEQLRGLAHRERADCFEERDRAVLHAAFDVARNTRLSEEAFEGFRRHFAPELLPEFLQLAGFYVLMSAVQLGTGVEVEPEFQAYVDAYWQH